MFFLVEFTAQQLRLLSSSTITFKNEVCWLLAVPTFIRIYDHYLSQTRAHKNGLGF